MTSVGLLIRDIELTILQARLHCTRRTDEGRLGRLGVARLMNTTDYIIFFHGRYQPFRAQSAWHTHKTG